MSCLYIILGILILVAIFYLLRLVWELVPVGDMKNRVIFVTGCDSGFGRHFAIKCAKEGIPIFAGCFTDEGCKSLENETRKFPGKLWAISLDVTNDESVKDAYNFVKKNIEPDQFLWAIVNNAGAATSFGPDEWVSIEQYKKAFDINTLGIIRCVHAFLPLLKESRGRILSTSSAFGRVSNPYMASYCISKYGVEAYMDTIRKELKPWGIKCILFEPGACNTNLVSDHERWCNLTELCWENLDDSVKLQYGAIYKQELIDYWCNVLSTFASRINCVDYVVDAYFHAVTSKYPRPRYIIGIDANLLYIPLSFFPTRFQDWISSFFPGSLISTLPMALKLRKDDKSSLHKL